jgi:hypothetical protein
MSGPIIAAGMRRAIRCPEATSYHHVLKSKPSFGSRISPVSRCSRAVLHSDAGRSARGTISTCVIILSGVGARRIWCWVPNPGILYGAYGISNSVAVVK